MNSHIIGDGGDTLEYFTYFSLIKENIVNRRLPLSYTWLFRYPHGLDPSLSDARAFVLLGGLLSLIGGDVFIYNALLIMVLTMNSFFAYWLSWLLTEHRGVSFVGGLLFGFSFWVLSAAFGSLSKVLLFGFPLLGAFIVLAKREAYSPKYVYLIAATFYLISLSSVALLQQAIVLAAIIVLICYFFYKTLIWSMGRAFIKNIPHVLCAATGTIVLIWYTFRSHFSVLLSNSVDSGGRIFSGVQQINPLIYFYPSERYFSPFLFHFIRQYVYIRTD